jgi:hypothetical protein
MGQVVPGGGEAKDLLPDPGAFHAEIEERLRSRLGEPLPHAGIHFDAQTFKIPQLAIRCEDHLLGGYAALGKTSEYELA